MYQRLLPASALVLALLPRTLPAGQPVAPPEAPADIRVEGDRILVLYDGATLFDGRIGNPGALRAAVPSVATRDGAVDQVLALFARQGEIEVAGTVTASVEAFPCESDRAFRARPVVRHSSGPSRSRLNQAVYDRRRDWVLSVDDRLHTAVTVVPLSDTPGGRTFALAARGREIVLRFRPRFYQRHVVFEFWQRTYQAPDGAGFVPGEIPAKYHSQVFVIRERRDHPQVVATSRHLTGGGVDLLDVSWRGGVLSGRSAVVGGEPYEVGEIAWRARFEKVSP